MPLDRADANRAFKSSTAATPAARRSSATDPEGAAAWYSPDCALQANPSAHSDRYRSIDDTGLPDDGVQVRVTFIVMSCTWAPSRETKKLRPPPA